MANLAGMEIEIPRDVAEAAGVPADLDAGATGPYRLPSPRRRRAAGVIYLVGAAVTSAAAVAAPAPGWVVMAALLALLGLYHFVTAWELHVAEVRAVGIAGRLVSFPVGHASAAVGFTGWRARPVWNVLVFSADEPPTTRALVRIDGVTAAVVGTPYEEAVPG